MADESKTITIQFRGDSTQLDDEVNNIDRMLKYLQYDTAALQKKMKFGGNYADQMDLYSKAITNVDEEVRLAMTNMYKWDDEVEKYGEILRTNGKLSKAEAHDMERATKMYAEYSKKVENLKKQYNRLTYEKESYNRLTVANWLGEEGKKMNTLAQGVGKLADSFKYMSLGAGAALTASASAAITFETAMANVNKVLRDSEKDYLGTLQQQILDMSRVLPLTAEEIAQVTANALQLGISAKDVGMFTETILKLGTATNISADEAAVAIAQLFNITGEQFDNIDKFGAALTNLGNKFPTFESNIMEMAERIAAAGSAIGMSTKDILGLSTALASMGLSAEAGGTAISTILRNIDTAVATNSKSLSDWAERAGMSSSEFRKAWEGDVTGTFQRLINSIAKSVEGGANLNVILGDLGINAARQKDAFSRLVQASDTLNDALYESRDAWNAVAQGEDGALNTEFAEKVQTLANQFKLLKNELYYVGVQLGDTLMPALKQIVDWARDVVNWFANLSPETKEWVTKLLVGIAAIYPALKGLEIMIKGVSDLFGGLSKVIGSKLIPEGFGEKAFGGLIKFILKFASKLALPIAAIAAFAASFKYLYNTFEPFRNAINGLASAFKNNMVAKTQELLNVLKALGTWISGKLQPLFEKLGELYHRFIEPTVSYLYTVLTKLVFDVILTLYDWIVKIVKIIIELLKPAIDVIIKVIQSVITFLTPLIALIIKIFGVVLELIGVIWDKLKPYVDEALKGIAKGVEWLSGIVSEFFGLVMEAFQWVVDKFAELFAYLGDTGVIYTFSEAFSSITGVLKDAWEWLSKIIDGLTKWAGDAPTLGQMRRDYEAQTGRRLGTTGVINNYFSNTQRNTFNGSTSQRTVAAASGMIDLINDGLGKKLTW